MAVADTWEQVKEELVSIANIIFSWLPNNQMKGNADKCQLITNQINKDISISILGKSLKNCDTVKILGISFDNHLSFEPHIKNICKVANLKLSALNRISPYLSHQKKRLLMNAFIKSQFSYCPLTWMFHGRILENKINRIHERCLRIVYCDPDYKY